MKIIKDGVKGSLSTPDKKIKEHTWTDINQDEMQKVNVCVSVCVRGGEIKTAPINC